MKHTITFQLLPHAESKILKEKVVNTGCLTSKIAAAADFERRAAAAAAAAASASQHAATIAQ